MPRRSIGQFSIPTLIAACRADPGPFHPLLGDTVVMALRHEVSHLIPGDLIHDYIIGGLLGGAVLGIHAGRSEAGSARFLVVAGGVVALTGSLGCVLAGLGSKMSAMRSDVEAELD